MKSSFWGSRSEVVYLGEQGRCAKPKGAEPSRLQVKAAKVKDDGKLEKAWLKAIWKRDGGKCRWCHRKVVKALALIPERGECHHAVPRENRVTRFDPRAALLLCASCHERLTGKVNERFVLVASKTFTVDGVSYPDASKAVRFKRIA